MALHTYPVFMLLLLALAVSCSMDRGTGPPNVDTGSLETPKAILFAYELETPFHCSGFFANSDGEVWKYQSPGDKRWRPQVADSLTLEDLYRKYSDSLEYKGTLAYESLARYSSMVAEIDPDIVVTHEDGPSFHGWFRYLAYTCDEQGRYSEIVLWQMTSGECKWVASLAGQELHDWLSDVLSNEYWEPEG